MQRKLLSIIIPVYRDVSGLRDTVTTLCSNNPDMTDFEIIICNDGGGRDEGEEFERLSSAHAGLKLINIVPNQGSYHARNEGIRLAEGEFLAFLDAGIIVQKGWYRAAITSIEDSDYVAGAVSVPLESAQTPCEIYNALKAFPMEDYLRIYHFGGAGNLIVKRSVFDKIGLFDERLRSGGDNEFGRRVFEQGYRQTYNDRMAVVHQPRNLEEMKKKNLRVLQGIHDLVRFYPERFGFLKSRFSYAMLMRRVLRAILFPRRDKAYRSGHLSFFDFFRIEMSLVLTEFGNITRLRRGR